MRIRLTLITGCLFAALAGFYITSPLVAAYKLREAVKNADTATVHRMVNWQSLRASIKATVSRNAKLLPAATKAARRASTSWWQRIRSALGHSMLDRFVERYITPKGLPELYRAKNKWHDRRRPRQPAVAQASLIPNHVTKAWQRIKRAEFTSPFRFVLEVEDRHKATRLIESTFQLMNISLSGFDWKLIAVSIRDKKAVKAHIARLNGFSD